MIAYRSLRDYLHRADLALMALVLGPEPTYARAGAAAPPAGSDAAVGQPGGAL